MKRIGDMICFVQGKITATMMLMLIIVVSLQIAARMIFRVPIPWTEEVSTQLLLWIVFTGSISLMIKGGHLSIDVLSTRFGPKMTKWAKVINGIVFVALSGFFFIYGLQLCTNPFIMNGRTVSLQIRRVYVYMILPISMGINTVFSFAGLIQAIRDLIRNNDVPNKQEASS